MNDIKKVKIEKKSIDKIGLANSYAKDGTIAWEAPDFIQYERGRNWYVSLFLGGAIFAALFFWMGNTTGYTGFIAIILAIIVLFILSHQKPKKRRYELSEDGFKVNDKLYPLTEFKSFYITFVHDLPNLHLERTKKLAPQVTAYMINVDAQKVSFFINDYLPENQKGEIPTSDLFSKWFRF